MRVVFKIIFFLTLLAWSYSSMASDAVKIRKPTQKEIEKVLQEFGVMRPSTIAKYPHLDLELEKDLIDFRANYCQDTGSSNCGSLAKYKGKNSFSYSFASSFRQVGAKEFFIEISPGLFNVYLDDTADGENYIDTVIELNNNIKVVYENDFSRSGLSDIYPSFPFVSVKHGTDPLIYLIGKWSFHPNQAVLSGDEFQDGFSDPIFSNLKIRYVRQNPYSEFKMNESIK